MYTDHLATLSGGVRFDLYVKAASDGSGLGDCPFCQCVQMYAKSLGIGDDQFRIHFVNTGNKTEAFLKLNEKGTVPVLVDNKTNQIFTDSSDMVKHFREQFPASDPLDGYNGPDKSFFGIVLPKLGKLLKNKDEDHNRLACEEELIAALRTIDSHLEKSKSEGNIRFLAGKQISELDCVFLPRLRHIIVAGGHYEGIDIDDFPSLKDYMNGAKTCTEFTSTCGPDSEIVKGWQRHRK